MILAEAGNTLDGFTLQVIVSGLLGFATQILEFITSNPLMLLMFASSLVGVGCYTLKNIKRTSKV